MLRALPGAEINLVYFFEHTASNKKFQMLGHKKIPLHCEKEPALSYQLLGIPTAQYTSLYYYWTLSIICPEQ